MRLSAEVVEIKNIAVKESVQGQGIGQLLLKDSFNRAISKGCKEIRIGTADIAEMQLYLYQKMGFEIYAIKKNFFIDIYAEPIYENGIQLKDMVMLRKVLK